MSKGYAGYFVATAQRRNGRWYQFDHMLDINSITCWMGLTRSVPTPPTGNPYPRRRERMMAAQQMERANDVLRNR